MVLMLLMLLVVLLLLLMLIILLKGRKIFAVLIAHCSSWHVILMRIFVLATAVVVVHVVVVMLLSFRIVVAAISIAVRWSHLKLVVIVLSGWILHVVLIVVEHLILVVIVRLDMELVGRNFVVEVSLYNVVVEVLLVLLEFRFLVVEWGQLMRRLGQAFLVIIDLMLAEELVNRLLRLRRKNGWLLLMLFCARRIESLEIAVDRVWIRELVFRILIVTAAVVVIVIIVVPATIMGVRIGHWIQVCADGRRNIVLPVQVVVGIERRFSRRNDLLLYL